MTPARFFIHSKTFNPHCCDYHLSSFSESLSHRGIYHCLPRFYPLFNIKSNISLWSMAIEGKSCWQWHFSEEFWNMNCTITVWNNQKFRAFLSILGDRHVVTISSSDCPLCECALRKISQFGFSVLLGLHFFLLQQKSCLH